MWCRIVRPRSPRPERCKHFPEKTRPPSVSGDHLVFLLGMIINRVAPGKLGRYPLETLFET
jgi:hypothetical protein